MKKQESTSSTTAILQEALEREQASAGAAQKPAATEHELEPGTTATVTITGLPVSASHTKIPIREEFRCRRFWFFYHDLRAFTTSVSGCILAAWFAVLFELQGRVLDGMSLAMYCIVHAGSTCVELVQ